MPKTYTYTDLTFSAPGDTELIFSVTFISDGNTGVTTVSVPQRSQKQITDTGSVSMGRSKNVKNKTVIAVSDLANLAAEEQDITVQYKINDTVVLTHSNPKSEEERPIIVLLIKILQP